MVTYAELIATTPRAPPRPQAQPTQKPPRAHASGLVRTLSIFGRRPADSTVASRKMRFSTNAGKSKPWQRRPSACSDTKSEQGTILRAVPPSEKEGVASSPPPPSHYETRSASHDEIVRSIRQTNPQALDAMASHALPQYSPPSVSQSSPKRSRTKKDRKSECNTHIVGVYRNGTIHWDAEQKAAASRIPFVSSASQAFAPSLDSPTLSEARLSRSSSSIRRDRKPQIQVIIPKNQQRSEFSAAPSRTSSRRSARSTAGVSVAGVSVVGDASSTEISPASSLGTQPVRTSVVSPLVPTQMPKPRRPANKRAPTTLYECEDEEEEEEAHANQTNKDGLATGDSLSSNTSNDTSASKESQHTDGSFYTDNTSMASADLDASPNRYKPLPELRRSVTRMFSLESPLHSRLVNITSPSDKEKTKSAYAPEVVPSPHSDSRPPTPPPKPQLIEIGLEFPWEDHPRKLALHTSARNPHAPPRPRTTARGACRVEKRKSGGGRDARAFAKPALPTSPTLSDVEKELYDQLTALTENEDPFKWDRVELPDEEVTPAPLIPPVPPKSARRSMSHEGRLAVSTSHIAAQAMPGLRRSASAPPVESPAELPAADVDVPADVPELPAELPAEVPSVELPVELPTTEEEEDEAEDRSVPRRETPRSIGRLIIPSSATDLSETALAPPRSEAERQLREGITPEVAEKVVVQIFQSLESLDDLFHTAVVNKGFYEVFKRYELELMRHTLWKMSPPAWERREMTAPSPPPSAASSPADDRSSPSATAAEEPVPEHTPASYYAGYRQERRTIAAMKALILRRCANFLRPETRQALQSAEPADAARVDAAFWRIWTFCRVFGGGRGREHDVVGQIDWLKGGMVAHQQACSSNVMSRDSLELSDVLLMAPDCFGQGNPGGLSAEQLYDMTELWTCLGVLIQGFEGRTEQAREFGVYEATDVRGGDIDGEELMLEEWYYYLLTLGLGTVLQLAEASRSPQPLAFEQARNRGWMSWQPPTSGSSRATFLKDAVSRVYEEKIASVHVVQGLPQRAEMRAITRERIQGHAAEIKLRKRAGDLRIIRMSTERPMSDWANVMQVLDRHSVASSTIGSPLTSPRMTMTAMVVPDHSRRGSENSSVGTRSTQLGIDRIPEEDEEATPVQPPASQQQQQRTASTSSSRGHSRQHSADSGLSMASSTTHPSHPQQPPQQQQHPALRLHHQHHQAGSTSHLTAYSSMIDNSDPAEHSAEKAIFRIVEMGFTADEAKHALRVTDMGDGLRIDRAVELLLRGQLSG